MTLALQPSERSDRQYMLAARIAAVVVIVLSLLVLAGWMFNVELLKSLLHPARIPMNPTTALCFVLSGAALGLLYPQVTPRRLLWLGRALALLAALIAIAKLLQYEMGWEEGVDRILFRSRLDGIVMSPKSAAAFVMVGLAMMILDVGFGVRRFHPAQALIAGAGCVAPFSVTGYLYNTSSFYSMHGYGPMAPTSAISFLALCTGLFCARPRRQPLVLATSQTLGGTVARRLVPGAFLVPMLLGWLRIKGEQFGLYTHENGVALFVVANIAVFNLLIWWCARVLQVADLRHQRAQAELRTSEERHRAIMEQSADGIYLVDLPSKQVVDCNPALERLLGFAPGEAATRTVYELVYDTPERVDQRLQQLMGAEGSLHGERQYRRKDGSPVTVESSASVISYQGRRVACTVVHDITQRKEAERLLRASEARARLIIDTANDAFVAMNQDGRIADWSPQAEAIFGWKREEAVGRILAETIIPERFRGSHLQGLGAFLETGKGPVLGQRLELAALDREGNEFPIELTVAAGRLEEGYEFFAFIHDITPRKTAEEERDRIFTLSLDMVCVAGFDGYFKRVNRAFEATLGYSIEEMLATPWIDMVHPDDRAATIAAGEKLTSGGLVLNFENRYRCKDGSYKWISWTSVPVVKEERIYGIARDMTERKRIEQELEDAARSEREAHRKLRAAQSQLVQSEKLAGLGQMVAGVAHEINNPLSFVGNNVAVLQRDIRGMVELLKLYVQADSALAEHQPELFVRIHDLSRSVDLPYTISNLNELMARSREGLRRIQQIVKDLRDFARLDQGDIHDCDINAGIESTLNIVAGLAKKKHVTIQKELGNIPLITCQLAKINQVVMNLLSNAIDACDENGTVTVRTHAADGTVDINVTDTGHGIDPAVRERIFDPFFTTKAPGQGTGLGLSISYGIVRDHGGRIEVDSSPGKGSTFTVQLPTTQKS